MGDRGRSPTAVRMVLLSESIGYGLASLLCSGGSGLRGPEPGPRRGAWERDAVLKPDLLGSGMARHRQRGRNSGIGASSGARPGGRRAREGLMAGTEDGPPRPRRRLTRSAWAVAQLVCFCAVGVKEPTLRWLGDGRRRRWQQQQRIDEAGGGIEEVQVEEVRFGAVLVAVPNPRAVARTHQ